MALPVVSLTADETILGLRTFGTFTPEGASPTPISFVCGELNDEPTNENKELLFPGVDGLTRPIRRDLTKQTEVYKVKLYSVDKIIAILGGLNGFKNGTMQFWIKDPQDDTLDVRLKSDAFPCTIERDGGSKFGDDYTTFGLKITSTKTSPVTWAANVAA
jgi:hypothetical protein